MAQTDSTIDKERTFEGYSYQLLDDIHRVTVDAARDAINNQFKDFLNTLVANGHVLSGSAAETTPASGNLFLTGSAHGDSGSGDYLVLAVKK